MGKRKFVFFHEKKRWKIILKMMKRCYQCDYDVRHGGIRYFVIVSHILIHLRVVGVKKVKVSF